MTMKKSSRRLVVLLAASACLAATATVEAFAILPTPSARRRDVLSIQRASSPTTLSVESTVPTVTAEKKEKVTKEAQELMDAFQARATTATDRPHLIVAQVAPSVRYVYEVDAMFFCWLI